MPVVAAVDCGTNSIRLLIVKRLADDTVQEISRRMEINRLGQGVDETGRFHPDALARTQKILASYVDEMIDAGVRRVRMVATSASRDVENREEFFEIARKELGRVIPGAEAEVISGQQEARLSFAGAVSDCTSADGSFGVVDLGGGSTEIVVGDKYQADGSVSGVDGAMSLNIGCVRLTERCLHSKPPTEAEVTEARAVAGEYLDKAFDILPLDKVETWVGLAGTFTTIAALVLGLKEYDPEKIHQSHISFDDVKEVTSKLLTQTPDERMEGGPMHAGRADIIGGGCVIIQELVKRIEANSDITEMVISERDILDGMVHDLLHRRS
ncbi:MAG TPA: Ppx/GppA family phosphatase [Corynebacteriales bacterium]|nr:Ppx/GppA family phosphatase [Mycobacteriales bacterium]